MYLSVKPRDKAMSLGLWFVIACMYFFIHLLGQKVKLWFDIVFIYLSLCLATLSCISLVRGVYTREMETQLFNWLDFHKLLTIWSFRKSCRRRCVCWRSQGLTWRRWCWRLSLTSGSSMRVSSSCRMTSGIRWAFFMYERKAGQGQQRQWNKKPTNLPAHF